MEEQEVLEIETLDEMTEILTNKFEKAAEDFVHIGYYLKKTRDRELYRQKGYKDIYEYIQAVFGFGRSKTLRFMKINDRYSVGGYSLQLEERYRGYGSSKLTEMLQLPEDVREAVPQEATVRDIREAKTIIRETEKRYDSQMELCDIAQDLAWEETQEPEWMEELARDLFRETCREEFKGFAIWLKSPQDGRGIAEDVLAFINPTKFKVVRLEKANVMLQEHVIRVMPYRNQGENREYTYIDFAKAFEAVFFPDGMDGRSAQAAYEEVYGEPLYPEDKREREKPGSTERGKKTERKKVPQKGKESAETDEAERKPGNAECEGTGAAGIPGQLEVEKDFPEHCPGTEEEIRSPYGSRKGYLDGQTEQGAAAYMAAAFRGMGNRTFGTFLTSDFWEEWFSAEVDEEGRAIETAKEVRNAG